MRQTTGNRLFLAILISLFAGTVWQSVAWSNSSVAPNRGAFERGTLSAARIGEEALGEFSKVIKVGGDEVFVRFKQSKLGDTLVVRDFEILNAKDYFGRAPLGNSGVRKVYVELLEDAKARGFDHIEIHYDRFPVLADSAPLRPTEINDLIRDIVIDDWGGGFARVRPWEASPGSGLVFGVGGEEKRIFCLEQASLIPVFFASKAFAPF